MLGESGISGNKFDFGQISEDTLKQLSVLGQEHFVVADSKHDSSNLTAGDREISTKESFESGDWAQVAKGSPGGTTTRLTGPVQFVWKLMECWRLNLSDAAMLLGSGPEDIQYVSDILEGQRQMHGRDIRDRIGHLFCIRRTLWSLFRDLEVENAWLREEHSMLDNKSPLSLMLGGSMEGLLLAREYVEAAAGCR